MDNIILDLGIGKGGNYIENDAAETLRIGADQNSEALVDLRIKRNLPVCQLKVESGCALPFADSSFTKVDIYFPHDTLLQLLVAPNQNLWEELNRVLKDSGEVNLHLDTFRIFNIGIQSNYIDGFPIGILMPISKAISNARNAGFNVSFKRLNDKEIEEIGTYTAEQSRLFQSYFNGIRNLALFKIIAKKS